MEIWGFTFVAGLIGSVFMDLAELQMSKSGVSSGVKGAYIGRWVKGVMGGVFIQPDIVKTSPVENEQDIGQLFHFIVGGGVVALAYPMFLLIIDLGVSANHLLWATLFGLLTCVLPWFVLMPSLGWGVFGRKAPSGSRPIIAPILSHIAYGLGIGISFVIYNHS